MTRFRIPAAVVAAALALAATACGSDGESGAEQAPTTTQRATQTATTTEAAPQPITADETRWLELVEGYSERLEANTRRSGRVTHLTMRRSAKLYAACTPMLRRAGDPGRLAPAQRNAERACNRLDRAARLLAQAIAASDPGGAVVVGTPEEKQFERSWNGAFEATGNAQYDLQRALERAHEIERSFES